MAYHVTAAEKRLCFAFRRDSGQKPQPWHRLAVRWGLFALLALGLSLPAVAALARLFPPQAQGAAMTIVHYPQVLINGKTRTLSAAAKIRNADNLIVMPSSLGNSTVIVKYTDNALAEIDRVWILSTFEASQMGPVK